MEGAPGHSGPAFLAPPEPAHAARILTDLAADPAPADLPADMPVPRARALVRIETRLVTRLVAWLEGLLPRKKRAPLPRALTRVPRPSAPGPAPAPGAEALSRRMLIALSEENLRLRRELEALRAARR